ncbi:SRPBCC family protein [Flagellimonas iocasae]|uniref:SRPBCC family protein n=1 Tax=Flagellimonas iocasae TaxID=2055905 RepID=A0ABW4XU24_9FLAO
MKTNKIEISNTIKAPVEKVWESWVKPAHITQWNFAADDWCCPKAENDLRVGGKYSARMEAKDGSFGFDFEAIYDEVLPMEKISCTMIDGRQAITTFENEGNVTKVTTQFDPEDQNPIEMQKGGWQAILDNFKKYVENLDG